MSAMQQAADDYLALRRSLGYRLEAPGRLVGDLARYLDDLGLTHVTVDAALWWATSPGGSPYWHWFRLSAVRGFAGYLHAFDDRHQVPPADLLARRYQRPVPFLFTGADIAALMKAAAERPARLHALNCQALIGLLAVTGMRPGEAYALDRDHVDLAHGRLSVVNGKYGKSRELALHPSTVIALQEYAEHRDYLCPRPAAPGFFVSLSGDRLHESNTDTAFRRLVGRAGLQPRSARTRPTLKSLRHSFAVSTLIGWYRDGGDVNARLPLLSTWLGHVAPSSTYWYLQATPELLGLAAARLGPAAGAGAGGGGSGSRP